MVFEYALRASIAATILFGPTASALTPADAQAARPATGTIEVVVTTASGTPHRFQVEHARTPEAQSRGLMYRTDLPRDGGMLFAPYPGDGSPPREAGFWMHNTPTPLDILFIRPDGVIARIAANAKPLDDTRIVSGEAVSAVLELNGGRAAELGIAEGDRVDWPGRKRGRTK
jgi:uncharacterized membrane protein (UPF0127 family)